MSHKGRLGPGLTGGPPAWLACDSLPLVLFLAKVFPET